ncbi:hypothetical protein C2G38_2148238 [Gigaspora rosea]|uniref:Uncharacterized protein n=1 Tax=Gigaspora rosea TaxID=44941 RepID=A0A397UFH0_9GLOM|nr:hypothetical protein C2G38_2148238 [Gigaspora rosea]
MSLFNGAKWKGITLKIQDAKYDYKQRHRNKDTMFAEDMSLVTDNNIDGRKGIFGVKNIKIYPILKMNEMQKGRMGISHQDKLPQSIIDSLKKLKNKSRVIAGIIE